MKSRFDEVKSTQIAGALLQLAGGRMNYMKLIKLMYIIDREALKRWGHPLTGDEYYSLPHGPIVSRVYDLIADEPDLSAGQYWSEFIKTHDFELRLEKPTAAESLSPADDDLINEVFRRYGQLNQWQLRDLSHDFPEWRDPNDGRLPIPYADILRAVGRDQEAEKLAGELEDRNYFATILGARA